VDVEEDVEEEDEEEDAEAEDVVGGGIHRLTP